MENAVNLTGKQKRFCEEHIPLIRKYLHHFEQGAENFEVNVPEFNAHKMKVIQYRDEIAGIFSIHTDLVPRFACEYEDKTRFFSGIFSRSECDHLYFIQSLNSIKIGRTGDPKTRMGQLQTSHPFPLSYIKVFIKRGCYEHLAHELFNHLNIRGEWFEDHQDIKDFISMLSSKNTELTLNSHGV